MSAKIALASAGAVPGYPIPGIFVPFSNMRRVIGGHAQRITIGEIVLLCVAVFKGGLPPDCGRQAKDYAALHPPL
ncbi:hypothetical protein EOK75_09910 [Pseudorhodobacter turbinis]|uniref:Uncharacterized protein n=1 Tax=Pseudorhodobacter turbinis TaxID=2500533 RepID=A0A4P8EH12_9RHOB|nr:hypothetical protein [Pseudorhodobacter turbinis]QCO56032.1 hypothetical protein EOK75_09910 [Pseudorhodobacter turbinis]